MRSEVLALVPLAVSIIVVAREHIYLNTYQLTSWGFGPGGFGVL